MRTALRLALTAITLCALAAGLGSTDLVAPIDPTTVPKTPGELVILGKDGKPAGACPLKHTDVDAQIAGFIARVNVVQEFHNPTNEKIEAVYTFPLPEDSAVDRMEMKVGERTIVGEIHRREEAREIYQAAKEAGHVASLLDQERPNIFTQSVANIMPGEQVKITISYTQLLKYEAGTYEFNFPMVVGPRFMPGAPTGQTGTGMAPDTDKVPDASKISPPITPRGTRAGHDISVKVEVQAGIRIYKAHCVTHLVDYEFPSDTSAVVTLKDQATIPNKDFVLKYDVAGDQLQSGLITTAPTGSGGFFALVMQPPEKVRRSIVRPKEMVFVIDTSGSQKGEPLAKSKETMLHCIRNVNPGDTFNMISFANSVKTLFDKPRAFNKANEAAALDYLKACEAGGGTHMLPAIEAALAGPYDPERVRIVVFFTDGYIGNDFQIIDAVQKNEGRARVFSFGIGNSVNRFLVEKMAEEGRGACEIVLLTSDSKQVAAKFYERIRNPLLTDITIDWNGLPVVADEVYPKRPPDLFSSQPLVLKGRFTGPASGEIIVRGKLGGQNWGRRIPAILPDTQADNDALVSVWARGKVEELTSKDWMGHQTGNPDPNLKEDIINVALDYNLMTQYTSFVAVERMTITEGGTSRTIAVPVEMPEGVSYDGVSAGDKLGTLYAAGRGASGGYAYFAVPRSPAPAKGAPVAAATRLGLKRADTREMLQEDYAHGEETAEQKNERLVSRKLDKTLRDLRELVKKSGESEVKSIPGKLSVKDGKVEVVLWLKPDSRDKLPDLEKLGLAGHTWLIKEKTLIGWIPISKLEEIALLEYVARLSVPSYAAQGPR